MTELADRLTKQVARSPRGLRVANDPAEVLGAEGARLDREAEERAEREAIEAESREAQKGPRFAALSDVFEPLPEPDYIVQDIILRTSLALLAAYGSSSKTWQGLDMCVSVAADDRWLGRFEAKRGRAAFLDYESGPYELRRRVQLLVRARGWSKVDGLTLVSLPPFRLGEPDFGAAADRLAQEHDLIVIDSLRAASSCDENDSRIRLGLDQLRAIGERRGCAFVVLVHAKKTSGSPTTVDEREVLRGSSAVFDAADVVLVSTYDKEEERFTVSQAKARHGRKVEPFAVRLRDVDGGVSVQAEDLPEAEPRPGHVSQGERFEEACERVRRVLRESPGIGTAVLRGKAGGNRAMLDGAIEHLLTTGEVIDLVTKRGQRTDHSYRLSGVPS